MGEGEGEGESYTIPIIGESGEFFNGECGCMGEGEGESTTIPILGSIGEGEGEATAGLDYLCGVSCLPAAFKCLDNAPCIIQLA